MKISIGGMNLSWTKKSHEKVTKNKEIRSFGLIVGGVLLFIGMMPVLFHNEKPRLWALIIAGLLIILALSIPSSLKHIYWVWMKIGHIMGWVNTRIILGICFFGIFTPIGLAMRLLKKDPMHRKLDPETDTYRVIRSYRSGEHMKRQF